MSTATRATSGRLAALTDQVLSGLSNFLTVALVARSVDPDGFGRFVVVYALFSAFVGLARQFWGTRISLTSTAREATLRARQLTGATLWVALPAVVVLVVPSLALAGREALPVIVLLAVALPVVVAQDLCRYAAIAGGRPAVAVGSDLAWVSVVAVAYAFRPGLMTALGIWLGGAVLALLIALGGLRVVPSMTRGRQALRHRHATGEVTALGYVGASLGTYVTLGLATLTVGAAAAGAVRGASTVMAPINTLFAFTALAMLPVVYRTPPSAQLRPVGLLSTRLVVVTALWAAALLLLPARGGELLLGDSWTGARAVLPWTMLEYVALAAASGAVLGLQTLSRARHLALVLFSGTGFVVSAAVLAALLGDSAAHFAAALAGATALYAVLAWLTYARRRQREPGSARVGESPSATASPG